MRTSFKNRKKRFPIGRRRATEILRLAIPIVRKAVYGSAVPSVSAIARKSRSPFRILVSTIISARTKDEVTAQAARRLFARADKPAAIAAMDEKVIASLIYPAGFYKTKARSIKALSSIISQDYDGLVPDTMEGLLSLPGVGRKTANLVLTLGFAKSGICVDTHVHRITNRLGVIRTDSPYETEYALRISLPKSHWMEINDLLVRFGKRVCVPISPHCSSCPLVRLCRRVGVLRYR